MTKIYRLKICQRPFKFIVHYLINIDVPRCQLHEDSAPEVIGFEFHNFYLLNNKVTRN